MELGFFTEESQRRCLSCGEIAVEERVRELGRKGFRIDLLKIHRDVGGHNSGIMQIVFENLLTNQEGTYHEGTKQVTRKSIGTRVFRKRAVFFSGIADSRGYVSGIWDRACGSLGVAYKKRSSAHCAWSEMFFY